MIYNKLYLIHIILVNLKYDKLFCKIEPILLLITNYLLMTINIAFLRIQ